MNKARLSLLLALPLIGVAFTMRTIASWRPQKVMVAAGPISGLVLSNDGKTLLVQHLPPRPVGNGMIALSPETTMALDVQSGFKFLWKRDYEFSSTPQFFSNNSKVLAPIGAAEILDAQTGKTLQKQPLSGDYTISPDGNWLAYRRIATDSQDLFTRVDGQIYLNPITTNLRQDGVISAKKVIQTKNNAIFTGAFSPDSLTLAVGTGDSKGAHIDLYSTKTWKLTRTWSDVAPSLANPRPYYRTIQWSRDGQFLFSSLARVKSESGQAVWRLRDGKKVASGILLEDLHPHLENGGRVLTYGGNDGKVNLCLPPDLNHNFKQLLHLPGQTITAAALSPDETYLLAATRNGTLYRQRLK